MRFAMVCQRSVLVVAFVCAMGWASQARAQFPAGDWVRTDDQGKGMVMTTEVCCKGGARLTYRMPAQPGQTPLTLTVESPMDGTDAPVLLAGKPSGQMMAIKRIDDHHYTATMKMNGQPLTTSTGTVSADGKSITIESVTQQQGGQAVKTTETWVKK